MSPRTACLAAALLLAAPLPAHAALTIGTNADIPAGIAAFGTATPLITWDDVAGATGIDTNTGASVTGNVAISNWINGPGFSNGAATALDLAINGPENFTLNFAAPVSRIGFAVSTGLGLLPNEISADSTSFTLRTSNGDTAQLTLTNPGNGLALWIDLQSSAAFTSLQFTENVGDLTDQYFGNFVAGSLPGPGGVPEPASWAMLIIGFGAIGAAMRQRPALRAVTA